MNKLFFLYGNDLSSIHCRVDEILKSLFHSQEKINSEEVLFNKEEDIDLFFNKQSSLRLFNETNLLVINIGEKIRKDLDNYSDKLINVINAALKEKNIIIKLYAEKYNKIVKNQVVESRFFIKLKHKAIIEEHEKPKYWKKEEIRSRVVNFINKHNLDFHDDAVDLYVEIYTSEHSSVHNNLNGELLKMETYVAPGKKVNKHDIEALYSASYNLEDLYLILIGSKKQIDFRLLSELDKNIPPLYLISVLQTRLRLALQIKAYSESKLNKLEISKLTGLHVYRVEKEMSKLSNIRLADLKAKVSLLSDVEYKIKTGLLGSKNILDYLLPSVFIHK